MQRVEILVYDGVDELDAVGPFEVLAAAGFEVELVAIDPGPPVHGAHGLVLTPGRFLGPAPDLLVVPGGGWLTRAPRGAWAEARAGVLPAAIAERHAAGSVVAGVCTGGMLRGRPAITHQAALYDLATAGAQVHADARVVDDGDLLTAGGVTAAIDLALHVVRRERGARAALAEARRIERVPQGPVVEVLRAA
jgi:transcriptional regulator GlxA family with amidase domain